jgi:hypothetical protein
MVRYARFYIFDVFVKCSSQVSITPINSASSVETAKMPMNAPLISQEGNMFFPGTQCLKVSIPSYEDANKVCFQSFGPNYCFTEWQICALVSNAQLKSDHSFQVHQLMLGFSSEGISGGQDLGIWRHSFEVAFANPESTIPVRLGRTSHFRSEQLGTDPAISNVSFTWYFNQCGHLTSHILQALHGMSGLCQQARVINIGSNLQNAGALRSLLGQLMPLVNEIRMSCDSPWRTEQEGSSSAASSEILDSFRLEIISTVDACVSALKEKMRIFQKRVMRKTATTPTKPSPASPCVNGQASPALSAGLPRFRADLQLSPSILPVPAQHFQSSPQKGPSSRSPHTCLLIFSFASVGLLNFAFLNV